MLNWILTNKEFILAIATFIASITAIIISVYQIHLSNKHQLFDRRINDYCILTELFGLCEKSQNMLNREYDNMGVSLQQICVDYISLTSNHFLEPVTLSITNPLEEHNKFINKMDDLKHIAQEILFVFPKAKAKILSQFIGDYIEVLTNQFRCSYSFASTAAGKNIIPEIQWVLAPPESEMPKILLQSYEKLNTTFNEIKISKLDEKLKKTIRL